MSRRRMAAVPDQHRNLPKPEIRSVRNLMAREMPPVRWVVPGILPEGVTLLAGKSKIRKSWLCMGLCIAVAAGGYAFGRIGVESGDALYLALEDNERRMQSRLGKILGNAEAPEGFDYATAFPRLDEGGLDFLKGWLEEHPRARLVVIDTLAKIRPRPRNSQGGYQEDYEALEDLLPLAAEHQVAILVVTHTRKAAATDVVDEINATTGLMGGVDGFMIVKTERGKNEATMFVTGREIEEEGELSLSWDRELHGWMLVGSAEDTRLTEQRRAILDVLRGAGEPMGPKAIAKAAGLNYGSVRNQLGDLAVDGRIERVGRGAWQLAEGVPLSPRLPGDDNGDDNANPHGKAENSRFVTDVIDVTEGRLTNLNRYGNDNDDNDDKEGVFPISKGDPIVIGNVIEEDDDDNKEHPWHCDCGEC